jgi:FkbM family methyltransferase
VDVGANVGLFSRQLASKSKNIKQAFLYEPHPENFEFLKRNLTRWEISPNLINAAISDMAGTLDFYEDPTNCGNYSLNVAAMPEVRGQIQVTVIQAQIEEEKWLTSGMPIFYKSDTQGFDEKIAANLSLKFWGEVRCAAFELWRINKPEFDIQKFAAVLDSFPYMVFESNPNTLVKAHDVLTYINGTDRKYDDLLCWR